MQVTLLHSIGVDDIGTVLDMPLRPEKLWRAIQASRAGSP